MSDSLPITLGLTPIAPGEEPPAECPHCGSARDGGEQLEWTRYATYACGASYVGALETRWGKVKSWEPAEVDPCPTPRASAVLHALAERERDAYTDAHAHLTHEATYFEDVGR